MRHMRKTAMRDYEESVTTRQTNTRTDRQTDAGKSNIYVPLCFACDTKIYTITERFSDFADRH